MYETSGWIKLNIDLLKWNALSKLKKKCNLENDYNC